MNARTASGVLLALGFADLAVLDGILAPRLATQQIESHAVRAEAAGVVAPVSPVVERPTLAAAAPPPVPPVPVDPAPAPRRSALADILFELGEAGLESYFVRRDLGLLAAELRADPGKRLLLRGHSDRLGSPAANRRLSLRRAEATAAFLIARGAPPGQLEIESVADAEPADSSDTPLAWAHNRRVELLWR